MTLKDIAKELGLSVNTVSDVLNGGDTRYSAKTRQRIYETAKRLGYRANRQAQILAGARSGLIGIIKVINFHQSGVERALYTGEAIHQNGFQILSYNVPWHEDGLNAAVQTMLDTRVEGVLLDGIRFTPEAKAIVNRLLKAKIPAVALNNTAHPAIPAVTADFYQGGRLVADHLLSLGYRKITIIAPQSALDPACARENSTLRVAGYRDRLAEAGCKAEVVTTVPATNELLIMGDSYESSRQAMLKILKQENRPEAVICANDHYAIGALKACREMGVEVPEEMALVGFDNTAVGNYLDPTLTSVAVTTRAVAEAAVDLLLRLIRKETMGPAVVTMPCSLVIRESCGSALRMKSRCVA